jgi:Ca-activated chloride channel homolog
MFSLDAPLYLLLLAAVPPLMYMRHFWKRRGSVVSFPAGVWKGPLFRAQLQWMQVLRTTGFVLFWAGVVLLILAVTGPVIIKRNRIYLNRGIDIMLVLDQSPSMSAKDFAPGNRFETAKIVIRDFIKRREHDPIGLVGFGKEAALRVPPTTNYATVLDTIDELAIMELGDGTAIGMGLAVAILHLESSTAEKRVIILVTDGENNAGEVPPQTAAAIAQAKGIRVYTVGVGTKGKVPLEFTDPNTGKHYRGVFESGFDEELLREIAQNTSGRYFPAGNSSSLASIFQAIDARETKKKISKIEVVHEPRHRLFITLGILCIGAEFIIRRVLLREVLP